MSTRNADSKLCILPETPVPESVKICGLRLPTYKQVLFCFLTNLETLRNEDKTKNQKAMRSSANLVVAEVLGHYKKARVPVLYEKKMVEKIKKYTWWLLDLMTSRSFAASQSRIDVNKLCYIFIVCKSCCL